MNKDMQSDYEYFIDKIIENKNDPKKVYMYARRAKLLLDSVITYNLHVSPDRKVFKIDLNKKSKNESETYIKELMKKYRNRKTISLTDEEYFHQV